MLRWIQRESLLCFIALYRNIKKNVAWFHTTRFSCADTGVTYAALWNQSARCRNLKEYRWCFWEEAAWLPFFQDQRRGDEINRVTNRLMSERRKTPFRLGAHSEITWASNVNRTWRIAPSCAGWTASGSQSLSRARRGRRRTRRAPTCEGCSPGGPVSCPATCWCPDWAGASLRRSSAGILRRDWSLCSASPAAWKSRREQSRSVIWESCTSIFSLS